MNIKQRRYIHGDKQEGDSALFYCSSCDAFFVESHFFSNEEKCCNHWEKYDQSIARFGELPKNNLDFFRPINAINIFSRN